SRQHAPRGPIKAAPHGTPDPIVVSAKGVQKCSATAKSTGRACQRWAIAGGTVCIKHGGAAPQVKAAAEKRLDELRPAAIRYLDWLINQKEYPSAGLGAAKDVLDRNDGK